mmetsp:Transcript_38452/g.28291  ORF Transcript_38452/g.28291 Transcript_38452/m.28291 type:complete len:82 (-) Transcript_38452:829-1074(-)
MNKLDQIKLYLIIAGGDGTVMYIVEDCLRMGFNIDKMGGGGVCFLPYGTGNDLGLELGWGNRPKKEWTSKLKVIAKEIIKA